MCSGCIADAVNYYIFHININIIFNICFVIFITIELIKMVHHYIKASRKAELAAHLEIELLESKINLMLSQIQPHFLYNALNTIQYLCITQPQKADEAVGKFSRYLRGNMDSLTRKTPIPFEQELEHLKNYLTIEQYRFPYIIIEFDIKSQDFSVPALTLQPLVENSIKHGVTQGEEEGGNIYISTWEDEFAWYIKVEDNGVGFDPDRVPQDGRSHIGIENTRNRLAAMCNGNLKIESTRGEGTRITVELPKS